MRIIKVIWKYIISNYSLTENLVGTLLGTIKAFLFKCLDMKFDIKVHHKKYRHYEYWLVGVRFTFLSCHFVNFHEKGEVLSKRQYL